MKSKVEVKNDEIVILVNTLFYPKDNVINTADKFNDFFWIQIEDGENNFLSLTLKPKSNEIRLDTAGYEFMNHLLSDVKDDMGD